MFEALVIFKTLAAVCPRLHWSGSVLVGFGISLRPILQGRGGVLVCYGMGELSDRERLRLGKRSGFGDESIHTYQ